nr:MAG TPA: hypothetical protein [Caudoviricetes sp.]
MVLRLNLCFYKCFFTRILKNKIKEIKKTL